MVPAAGIEPATFGLQNRCSTAELSRRTLANQSLVGGSAGTNRGFATDPGLVAASLAHHRINCHGRCSVIFFEQIPVGIECHIGLAEASRDERGHVGVPQSVERYSMQLQSLASRAPQPGLADGAHGRAVQIANSSVSLSGLPSHRDRARTSLGRARPHCRAT
jgi:hypothetical protein